MALSRVKLYAVILLCIPDESVMNSMTVHCFSDCDSDSPSGTMDDTTDNENTCCATASTTSGYGTDASTCTADCKL